ncbi:hypothetical protein I5H63_gp091 [Mycobacterium phage MilleniumForce]|uniref:Uncharacterized protein n=1 Tax=Mycobacterium phage MilleniumForce TaxID=2315711 RepID=A0A386KNF0_9CAUD|nr:hypothetical protein I5H63_gp091 [Mycobacterium phage MilleniumForce]AYD86916.1 hypothetical protein SEA_MILLENIUMFORCE_91 [Mycobacterium phage MilleniumForce]
MMTDVMLAIAGFELENDVRNNWCRICWDKLDECPGHVGYMEMFGPPPTEEELTAYAADLEVRRRGIERRAAALNHAAVNLGYDSIEDLCEKVDVGSVVQSEPNQEGETND